MGRRCGTHLAHTGAGEEFPVKSGSWERLGREQAQVGSPALLVTELFEMVCLSFERK